MNELPDRIIIIYQEKDHLSFNGRSDPVRTPFERRVSVMSFELSHNISDPQIQAALQRAREERSKTFAEVFSGFSALVHLPGQLRRKALGAAQKLTPYEPVACG
jgi:hypothetical protein